MGTSEDLENAAAEGLEEALTHTSVTEADRAETFADPLKMLEAHNKIARANDQSAAGRTGPRFLRANFSRFNRA